MCSILILGRTMLEQPELAKENVDKSYLINDVEKELELEQKLNLSIKESDKKNIKDLLDKLNINSDIPIMVYFYDVLGDNSTKTISNIVCHNVSGTFLNIENRITADIDYIIQDYSVPITTEEWKKIIDFANNRNVKEIITRGNCIEKSMKLTCKSKLLKSLHEDLKQNIVNQSDWFSIRLAFGKTLVNLKVFP